MKDVIINKLHDFLLEEESVPVKDSVGIITAQGIDAHARRNNTSLYKEARGPWKN